MKIKKTSLEAETGGRSYVSVACELLSFLATRPPFGENGGRCVENDWDSPGKSAR